MAFSELLTKNIRRRCHFQCCLCKALGVEIHHIVPQSERGPDTDANAAPLCPSCHEVYGANPTKRKFIREARDLWYEICERRYAPDSSMLGQVREAITQTASKEDVSVLRREIGEVLKRFGPVSALRTIAIPRKQSNQTGRRELDLRDLLVLVHGTPTDRPLGQTELLCLKELWPLKNGYRGIRKEFLLRFGDRTLRHLAARALDEAQVPIRQGLTEDEITAAFDTMSIEAVCMLGVDKGDLTATVNDNGEVLWGSDMRAEP